MDLTRKPFTNVDPGKALRKGPINASANVPESPPPNLPVALTPLTGRDTEFGLLKDRWEQAQERLGQVVLIVGEAGLGKSRLVRTLTQLVEGQAGEASLAAAHEPADASVNGDSPVIEWRCSQPFQNSELHP